MRHKAETASLAERLNNALAQLHAQKLYFETERSELSAQLDRAKEEIQRLRGKNRELRRGREQEGQRGESQGEQILMKIVNYLSRVQQSARQMSQVADECRVFDAEIQRAAALIQKNIIKSASGLQKYSQQFVRQWCQRETLRLENERLQAENKQLFQLTTKLQQNFKETDRYLKQLTRNEGREDKYSHELKGRINRLQEDREGEYKNTVMELQQKIMRLGQKLRSLQQQNTTIKNIHQRTIKKLQRLEQKNRDEEQSGQRYLSGQALEQERRRWLLKSEEMHEQLRRLTKQLLLAEQSEGKAKEQLASCVQIYGQWQIERQQRKTQIDRLKVAIQTYLQRIEQLQQAVGEARGETQAMIQRLQVSEGEKEKIVSVYQLQVQQLNDLIYKKQDALAEMDGIISKQHLKMEQLKKQHTQLTKYAQNLQDTTKKAVTEAEDIRKQLIQQEKVQQKMKDTISDLEQTIRQLKVNFQKERVDMKVVIEQQQREKQQMVEIMNQYKDEYYSAKRQMTKLQQDYQKNIDQQFSSKQELRNILAIADDSIDVWTLLANVRDRLNVIIKENKSLKEAQRELLLESQSKERQANAQIQELGEQYESLRQSMEEERRNQLFSLKMMKMKAVEQQICSQNTLSKVNSLKELIQILIDSTRRENNNSQSHPDEQVDQLKGEIEQLKAKIILLQHRNQQNQQQTDDSSNIIAKRQQQLNLLRMAIKQIQQLSQQTQQELLQQKQTNRRLLEQMDCLKMEQQGANKQMEALAQELSKIQNQMDDYHDEKSSIKSKLQHARLVYLKNEQLQAKVTQLQASIQHLQNIITYLQSQYRQNLSPFKSSLKADGNSDLLLMQSQSPAKDKNISYKSNVQEQQYLSQISALLQQNKDLQSQIQQKRERIDELEHSLLLMNEKHELLTLKVDKFQQQLVIKQKQLQEYKHICTRLEQEKEIFAAFRQQLLRTEQQNKEQHLEEGNQFIQLTLENQASMQQIEDLEERIEQLRKQLDQKNQKIAALQIQLRQLHESHEDQKKEQVKKSDVQFNIAAREQELRISLEKVREKEAVLHKQMNDYHHKSKQMGVLHQKLSQQSLQNALKYEQISQKQKQVQSFQLTILKRQQQLKKVQKQLGVTQESLLGMESMRQSKKNFNVQEQVFKQMKEQLRVLRCTVQQKDSVIQVKQSIVQDLLQKHKEKQTILQKFGHDMSQLQQELNEYKEHSQNLKCTLEGLTHEKQQLQEHFQQLKRERILLEEEITHLNNLLQQNSLKNKSLSQKLQKQTIQSQTNKVQLQKKNMQIHNFKRIIQQKEGTIKQLNFLITEKQNLVQIKQIQLIEQQKISSEALSQLNNTKNQKNNLMNDLRQMEQEVSAARLQNIQYADRLGQIEEIMHVFKAQEAQNEVLRQKLDEALIDKQKLEDIMKNMQNNYALSSNNIAIFEKRNKELTEQLSACREQSQVYRLGNDKLIKDIEKYKDNAVRLRQSMQRYERIGTPSQIVLKLQNYAALMMSSQQIKQKCGHLQKSNGQLKTNNQQLQRQLIRKQDQISVKTASTIKIQQQNRQLKQIVKKSSSLDQQNERLSSKSIQLKQELQQLREQLLQKQARIAQLKQSHAKELAQRQLLQSQLRDRQAQRQSLQHEAEHYRQEVKRISKEKAQVKSQAIKSKMLLEQQQSMLKNKQSQLMRESSQRGDVIRQLKQQIDSLKVHNSVLQEQSHIQSRMSRRSSTVGNNVFQVDLPLQIPPRSRQRSVQMQLQDNTSQQHGRIFSKQSKDKLSTRLRESQKSKVTVNHQIEALRGELKGRQASIDSLQRQFKSKVQDYSKQQRIVESLRDELNLQRKRVKNFEDLYQSIQEKRIKMVNPKVQQ